MKKILLMKNTFSNEKFVREFDKIYKIIFKVKYGQRSYKMGK